MGAVLKCELGLFLLLHRQRQWPEYLIDLEYDKNEARLKPENFRPYPQQNSSVLSLRLVPEYFNYRVDEEKIGLRRILQHNWGYAIKLNAFESARDYLSQQFKSSARKGILRYVRRLEHCFEISYKLHYGEIERDNYEFLMQNLHRMITARFDMKGDLHKDLRYWDQLWEQTYEQIINNEASLFVIYHKGRPIEISLNYHLGKMLFSSISSFDMDYTKFGLGHVEIYKQLEWCFKNDYILYDMGVGGTDYKRRWSNFVYRFEHHILYPKAERKIRIPAWLEISRVRLKEFLKTIGVNEIPQKLQRFRNSTPSTKDSVGSSPIQLTSEGKPFGEKQLKELSLESAFCQQIKKQLNDFLYSTEEQERDIKIWQWGKMDILIEGKRHYQVLKTTEMPVSDP